MRRVSMQESWPGNCDAAASHLPAEDVMKMHVRGGSCLLRHSKLPTQLVSLQHQA